MYKKVYIVLAILSLACISLYAQTTLTLTPPNGAGINTTTTVTPTLSWVHRNLGGTAITFNGTYQVLIATNAQLENPIEVIVPRAAGVNTPQSVTVPGAQALQYDTTYYWQVRQYYPTITPANELEDPSAIGTFRTPKVSVAPFLRWAAMASPAGNYEIRIIGGGETFTIAGNPPPTGSTIPPNYFQLTPATIATPASLLKYNTTYTWSVRKGTGAWMTQTPFTTKELQIFEEYYEADGITGNLYQNQLIDLDTNSTLTYTAITDEFENFSPELVNAQFFARSTMSDPNRAALKPTYGAPTNGRTTITKTLEIVPFTGTPTTDISKISLTDGETLVMQFQYGNAITLLTDSAGSGVATNSITIYKEPSYDPLDELTDYFYNLPMYISVASDSTLSGLSKSIVIQVMETGKEIVKAAFSDTTGYYDAWDPDPPSIDPNAVNRFEYSFRLPLTVAEINTAFYGNGAGQVNPQRPIRLHIYVADNPTLSKDIIWTGNVTSPTQATSVTFGAANYDLTDTPEITGDGWIRLISSIDPVGIIVNAAQLSEFYMGPESFYPATLAAGYISNGTSVVQAVQFNYPIGSVLASFALTPQTYTAFQMVTPTDFTTNVDVYPRFSWTQAFTPERSVEDMTNYRVRIWTAAAYTAGGGFQNNPATFTYYTTDLFLYPPEDFAFNQVYYWRVDVTPTAAGSAPTNVNGVASQYAWTFTTCLEAGYTITSPIVTDRTLGGGTYIIGDGAVVEPGATLTILDDTILQFRQDVNLIVNGSLDIQGDTEGVLFEKVPDATSWGGILFASDNTDPLVVDDAYNYISGPHIKGLTITDATNPIDYADGVQYDIYIEESFFHNNDNGIRVSDGSYLRNVEIDTFNIPGTAASVALDGGYYINNVTIDGTMGDPYFSDGIERFLGNGIVTTAPNAIITENDVTMVAGDGISVNAGAGNALIHLNTVTATGTTANNIAIKANPGATVTANKIGNYDPNNADPALATTAADRNAGYAIQNGALIADNTIIQNGNGAILADTGATVLNNYIEDNKGYGISRGNNIVGNQIINTAATAGTDKEGFRSTNAITADADAYVAGNTITNTDGYGISGGEHIFNNTISWPNQVGGITPPLVNPTIGTHYAITATPGATVEQNTITNPYGYGILNGSQITGNTIIANATAQSANLPGAFGIRADTGATVANNRVTGMKGMAIENGVEIRDNIITNTVSGIRGDLNSVVINNTLNGGGQTNGFAIHNGVIINNNTINAFKTGVVRALLDIVWSEQVTEFRNNDIRDCVANGGSVVNAEKPAAVTTSLAFTGNVIKNNEYTQNHVRVSSTYLTFADNLIDNTVNPTVPRDAKGLIDPTIPLPMGEGTGVYLRLVDNNARLQRNFIIGHLGAVNGAGLFIDSANPAFMVIIDDQNTISGNEAMQPGSRGAGVFVNNGTVYLGSQTNTPPPPPIRPVLGNTITDNKIDPQGIDAYVTEDQIPVILADGFVPAGAGVHIFGGTVYLYRNIIAANRGNWGIYGAPIVMTPSAVTENNIYDNYIIEPERTELVAIQDKVNQNFYYTSPTNLSAINNFWGTRSDLGLIYPSIYDRAQNGALGVVTYQPILAGPSEQTPGIVDNIAGVRVLDKLPYPVSPGQQPDDPPDTHVYGWIWSGGLIGYERDNSPSADPPIFGHEYLVIVNARDNNDFSADFTEVIIENTRTGQFIRPLLWETGLDHEVYVARFRFTDDNTYDSDKNWLPGENGDVIRIWSVKSPSILATGIIGQSGDTFIEPYVNSFNFGSWAGDPSPLDPYVYHYEIAAQGTQPLVGTQATAGAAITDGDYRYSQPIFPYKKFTFTNAGSRDDFYVTGIHITGTDAGRFSILSVIPEQAATAANIIPKIDDTNATGPLGASGDASQGDYNVSTHIPPGTSFDVVVAYLPTGTGTYPGTAHTATLGVEITIEEDDTERKHDRKIELTGFSITDWEQLPDYAGLNTPVGTENNDFFGDPIVLTNQMTVVGHVTINGKNANMYDVVGAYTLKNMKEELRGKYIVQQTGGLATIVVNFDRADEEIFFKVYDHTNHVLYETPPSVNIRSITNGTIGQITPYEITALSQFHNTGQISDTRDPAHNTPIPGVVIQNMHGDAKINNPYKHVTDRNGYYFKTYWFGEKQITMPQKKAWDFDTYTNALTDNWDTPTGTTSTPNPREIEPNAQAFKIGSTGGNIDIVANDVYYNYRFADVTDDGTTTPLPGDAAGLNPAGIDTALNHDLDETGLYFVTDALPASLFMKYTDHHRGMDFRGTIEKIVVAGKLSIHEPSTTGVYNEILLANLTFDVVYAAGSSGPTPVTTDENGQFYFLVDSGTEIDMITISQAQLDAAGYSHVVPDAAFISGNVEVIYPDPVTGVPPVKVEAPIYDFDLQLDTTYWRTQVINLKPGWNLISFNVEMDPLLNSPEVVFAAFMPDGVTPDTGVLEIRTLDEVATVDLGLTVPAFSDVSTLSNLVPGQGYYVLMDGLGVDPAITYAPLVVEGRPAKVENIGLIADNWNLVGYTPGRVAQTRAVVHNDPAILQIDDTVEAYFWEDVVIGSSTLRFMEPGTGYWVHASTAAAPAISYNSPIYNNVVKSFRIAPFDSTATIPSNEGHAWAEINNDYAGFMVAPADTLIDDWNDLVEGETYKIVDIGSSAWTGTATDGEPRGNLGEVFTVPIGGLTGIVPNNDAIFRPFRGPKQMTIRIPTGYTLNDTNSDATNVFEFNTTTTFDPQLGKVVDEATYLRLYNLLTSEVLTPGSEVPGGWMYFLDDLALATTGTDYRTFDYNASIGVDENLYLIFASQDLSGGPATVNNPNQKQAQVVVYHLDIDRLPASTFDDELIAVWIAEADGSRRFKAIQTGGGFTIAIPDNYIFTSPVVEFATNGVAVYAEAPGSPAVAADPLDGWPITSGVYNFGVPVVTPPNPPTYPTPGPVPDSFTLWVYDGATTTTSTTATPYNIDVVKLPAADFILRRPNHHFASGGYTPPANRGGSKNDPFGTPRYNKNNQLIMVRLTDGNLPLESGHTFAAYVGDELRGKTRTVQAYNGQVYAPILVSTVVPGETITFKLGKNGTVWSWENANTFVVSNPGGTTGSFTNPHSLNKQQAVGIEDIVAPTFINQLNPAYPNPFNPTTTISFSLQKEQHANISVYNIKGQKVNTLVNEVLPMGHHKIIWNGDNAQGRQIGSGIYFIRMQTAGYTKVEKAVLIK